MVWIVIAAALAAAGQGFFAYRELLSWNVDFVKKVAPDWARGDLEQLKVNVEWAGELAKNMAIYNLLLALCLAWTAWAAWENSPSAVPFAIMLGLFLLGAAAAAGWTQVYFALAAQGILGALLLAAVWLA